MGDLEGAVKTVINDCLAIVERSATRQFWYRSPA